MYIIFLPLQESTSLEVPQNIRNVKLETKYRKKNGGRDFFKGHRTDDKYFNDLWDAIPSENKDTTALIYFDHMPHKMSSSFAEYVVPICIEFCLSGKMLDNSIVAEFVSKIKRADTGKFKTNCQYVDF